MAIAYLATSYADDSNTGASPTSWTYDSLATGSDRCLVVAVSFENAVGVSAVTYNSVSMVKAVEYVDDGGSFTETTQLWVLAAPATGSNTLALTIGTSGQDLGFSAAVFTGVDQTTPFDGTAVSAQYTDRLGMTSDLVFAADSMGVYGISQNTAQGLGFTAITNSTQLGEYTTASAGAGFEAAMGYRGPEGSGATYELGSDGDVSVTAGGSCSVELLKAAVVPTLSLPTPSGTLGTQTAATLGATTDEQTGTFYGVVDSAANLVGVTDAQVKAGENKNSVAAVGADSNAVADSTPTADITGLTAATLYSYAVIQNNTEGDSNQVVGTFTTAVAALVVSGPSSTTEGAVTVETGNELDTVTTQSFVTTVGGFAISQTIDAQPGTTLTYTAESGVNDCTPGSAANGVPLEPTITATGFTAYQLQQKADDGVSPVNLNITLNAGAAFHVVQTMIAVADATEGSFFDASIVVVEDDHQLMIPTLWGSSMTVTITSDGQFETDKNETHTERASYFAPSTGNWGCVDLTITEDGSLIVGGTTNVINIGIGIGI